MRFFFIILSFICLNLFGQTNVNLVSLTIPTGNVWMTHANDLTPSAPADTTNNYYVDGVGTGDTLETITEVIAWSPEPGDTIFFKEDITWRLVDDGDTWEIDWIGAEGLPIVISTYGSGDKPRILGSDIITNWTDLGSNVWYGYKASLDSFPAGRVWFELSDTVAWGILETDGSGSIDAIYEYYYANDTVYIYSESDPSSAFTSVEIPQVNNVISLLGGVSDSSEYVVFDGLEIAYSTDALLRSAYPGGTNSGRELKGVEVRNCHIHHCNIKNSGRAVQLLFSDMIIEDNEINDGGRTNIAITPDASYFMSNLRNIVIRNNYVHDGWHNTLSAIISTVDSFSFPNSLINWLIFLSLCFSSFLLYLFHSLSGISL